MAKAKWRKTRELIADAQTILAAEWPMTVRQLFYRLVSGGAIENTRADYCRLSRVLTRAREEDDIPFDWIVDRSRPIYAPSVFENVEDGIKALRDCYRKDYWQHQPFHCETWCEKDAVIGSIQPVTDDLGVTVRVGRGFNSATRVHEIAGLFAAIRKPIRVFYLGDHDPSGRCIEVELYRRALRYGSREFDMKRLAIHAADITRFNLPPLRVKDSDSRAKMFRAEHGSECVELDALPPDELRRRVREAIEGLLDVDAWNRALKVEKVERESIASIVARIRALPSVDGRQGIH
jgi:hypothetical protein